MWAPIIAAIIQALIPFLTEWLQKWIANRLHDAANGLPPVAGFPTNDRAVTALFDRAINRTRGPARRALLRWVKAKAVAQADALATGTFVIPYADEEEISDLGVSAENE